MWTSPWCWYPTNRFLVFCWIWWNWCWNSEDQLASNVNENLHARALVHNIKYKWSKVVFGGSYLWGTKVKEKHRKLPEITINYLTGFLANVANYHGWESSCPGELTCCGRKQRCNLVFYPSDYKSIWKPIGHFCLLQRDSAYGEVFH